MASAVPLRLPADAGRLPDPDDRIRLITARGPPPPTRGNFGRWISGGRKNLWCVCLAHHRQLSGRPGETSRGPVIEDDLVSVSILHISRPVNRYRRKNICNTKYLPV